MGYENWYDNKARDALYDKAQDLADDIGVANYLMAQYSPGANMPGDIVNYALRFDLVQLSSICDRLGSLIYVYDEFGKDNSAEQLLEEWEGKGATAFGERWSGLRTHINNESSDGVQQYLEQQVNDMWNFIFDVEKFQEDCAGALDQLDGLRDRFNAALVEESHDGGEEALSTIASYSGTGAGVGSAGGPTGTIAGALGGALAGMAMAFNAGATSSGDVSESSADDGTAAMSTASDNIGGYFTKEDYGKGGQISHYSQADADDAFDRDWSPS